jgi:hypothetical protein
MMTFPDLDMLQNSLLSPEVSRQASKKLLWGTQGKTFESENYQLNCLVLVA